MRMDDVQGHSNNQAQTTIMDIFISRNLKLSAALEMAYIEEDPIVLEKLRQWRDSGLFELTIHGWAHVDYTTLSLSAQEDSFRMANKKLYELYGITSPIFVPPYLKFNADTLQAMKNAEYSIISSARTQDSYPLLDSYGITHLPMTMNFAFSEVDSRGTRTDDEILDALDSDVTQKGFSVFVFHPQDFVVFANGTSTNTINQSSVDRFASLVDTIRSRYNIVHLADVVGGPNAPLEVLASPVGGTYHTAKSVTLRSENGSTIYYTTDGTTPDGKSTPYTSPISIAATTTLKAVAKDVSGNFGPVMTNPYHVIRSPIVHMSSTTESKGLSVWSGRQAHVEYVSPTSVLVDKSIDEITVKLKKSGSPTGTAEIGVFNSDLTVKKLFGTIDVSALTTSYIGYTFSLPNNETYTVAKDDMIGIKYAGGNSTSYIAIMTDDDSADPFDGTNSYRQHYTTSWGSFESEDLYMILKESNQITIGSGEFAAVASIDGKSYEVTGRSATGQLVSVAIRANESVTMIFDKSGTVELTLPKTMIDGITTVLAGDTRVDHQVVSETENATTISLTVPEGETRVHIMGTFVVPEFPVVPSLMLGSSIAATVIFSRFRKAKAISLSKPRKSLYGG
jgi:hypothetical protein